MGKKETYRAVILCSIVCLSVVASGVVAASEMKQADTGLSSGATVWQGQTLHLAAGEANATETWQLREVSDGAIGQLVTEFVLNQSGEARVSTFGLEGRYVIVDGDENPVHLTGGQPEASQGVAEDSFEVVEQELNATFADASVSAGDGATELELDSNREGYSVILSSNNLSASQLVDIVEDAELRDGEAVVARSIGGDGALALDFSGVEPGTYEITAVGFDSTATATASITVQEALEGTASFASPTVSVSRGDIAAFTVELNETDRASVAVGSPAVNYVATFDVVDENGDGEVEVRLNTFTAGQQIDAGNISAAGEDSIANYRLRTSALNRPLDTAVYDLNVSVGGTETDIGSLMVTPASLGETRTWIAPEDASLDTVAELRETVTERGQVARGDWAVIQIQASGLSGYVTNVSDLDDAENGLSLTIAQSNPPLNAEPEPIPLSETELLLDSANGQFFLLVDTSNADTGSSYRVEFTASGENPLVQTGENQSTSAEFAVVERTVTFDTQDGQIVAALDSNATVSGSSSLAPGSEFTVELRSTGANPFIQRDTVTVDENGQWSGTFDLTEAANGTVFTALVDDPEAEEQGVVLEGAEQATEGEGGDAEPATTEEPATEMTTETETEEPTVTTEETETTTEAAMQEETTVQSETVEETTETDGQPGLGLWTGLVAVLLAILLIARNRR